MSFSGKIAEIYSFVPSAREIMILLLLQPWRPVYGRQCLLLFFNFPPSLPFFLLPAFFLLSLLLFLPPLHLSLPPSLLLSSFLLFFLPCLPSFLSFFFFFFVENIGVTHSPTCQESSSGLSVPCPELFGNWTFCMWESEVGKQRDWTFVT